MRNEDDFFQYRDELPRGRAPQSLMAGTPVEFWVIYDRGRDFEAKKWRAEPGFMGPIGEREEGTLAELRARFADRGLVRVGDDTRVDPIVVETWI